MRAQVLALVLAVSSCGGSKSAVPAQASLQRLALTHLAAEPPAERVVRRIEPPPTLAGWQHDAPTVNVLKSDNQIGLHLLGARRVELAIPGPFEPGLGNLVAVEVAALEDLNLRVGLRRENGDVLGSLDLGFVLAGQKSRLEFDLRKFALAEAAFDRLVLLANCPSRYDAELDWILHHVEWVDRPLGRWLPTAGEDAGLIELNGEARRGFGLVAGSPLVARVRVPESGKLRWAHGPAPRSDALPEGLSLRVQVDGQAAWEHRPEDGWKVRAWADEELDLAAFAGRDVELSFALHGRSEFPAAIALAQPILVKPQPEPATVVLITSDTHRAAYLGTAGLGVDISTPNLDALAARGVLFEDCLASSNNTLPAHVSLMTGLDPAATGVANNRTKLSFRAATLAETYAGAGYVTMAVTSAKHMNDPWSGLGQGFDRFSWPSRGREQAATDTLDEALDWLNDVPGASVFLWVHLFDVHRPYEPREELARQYYGDGDPYRASLPKPAWPRPGNLARVRDAAWVESLYRGEVSQLDGELARLLDHERIEGGLIAFTADHGESLGEQGIWWNHLGVYPAVLHVPLILAWPGAPAGKRVRFPVHQTDVARTLLGLSGLDEHSLGGRDLAPIWAGALPAESARFALGSDGQAASVTVGGWHLVVNLDNLHAEHFTVDIAGETPVQLFHLAKDPGCERDLSSADRERVQVMGRALVRWLEGAEAGLAESNLIDPAGAAMMAGLGYATADVEGAQLIDMEALRERLEPWL